MDKRIKDAVEDAGYTMPALDPEETDRDVIEWKDVRDRWILEA